MATATKKARAADPADRAARKAPVAHDLEFLIYRDIGGRYHWEIEDGTGDDLVQSGGFSSQDDAIQAARSIYEGADSARFALHTGDQRHRVAV
jgi:uncharacterized protein YegP (UPF0339 family)